MTGRAIVAREGRTKYDVLEEASAESVFMVGAGGNYVWIEPAHAAVIVVRWIDSAHFDEFTRRVSSALRRAGASGRWAASRITAAS